jgi:hypothetical protein
MAMVARSLRPLLLGGWVCALALLTPLARASSPAAWKAYDLEVRQACLKASGLKGAKVMGQRVDVPELSTSVLLLVGRNPQDLGGQARRELCLFTQNGRRAVVVVAEPLDRPRWPYPAPGVTLPAPTGAEAGVGGLGR